MCRDVCVCQHTTQFNRYFLTLVDLLEQTHVVIKNFKLEKSETQGAFDSFTTVVLFIEFFPKSNKL